MRYSLSYVKAHCDFWQNKNLPPALQSLMSKFSLYGYIATNFKSAKGISIQTFLMKTGCWLENLILGKKCGLDIFKLQLYRIVVLCLGFARFCSSLQFPAGMLVSFTENPIDFFQSWKCSSLKQLQDEILLLLWSLIHICKLKLSCMKLQEYPTSFAGHKKTHQVFQNILQVTLFIFL